MGQRPRRILAGNNIFHAQLDEYWQDVLGRYLRPLRLLLLLRL